MLIIGSILGVLLISFLGYLGYRFWLGNQISKHMLTFARLYDSKLITGVSKEQCFEESVTVFKKCRPFHKITENEWNDICRSFSLFDDPKAAFLKLIMLPSWKAVQRLKSPEFLKDLRAIKNKGAE